MSDDAAREMTPGEANAIATTFGLAALLRHFVARGALAPAEVAEIMESARTQVAAAPIAAMYGDFALRSVLTALHAVEELAAHQPPKPDLLGR